MSDGPAGSASGCTPDQIDIRRLSRADAEPYRRIRLSTLATEPDNFGSAFEEQASQPLDFFAQRLAGATVFAACTSECFVGIVHFRRMEGIKQAHKGAIQGFFVEPEWRQRGVGSALMTAVLDTARREVEQLHLTVVQGNAAAVALYRRFGFETYGIEPRALKTSNGYLDELLMALRFADEGTL